MKPTAVLVNTSRGPSSTRRPSSARCVTARSSPPARRHRAGAACRPITRSSLPNCIVVPHVASASRSTRGKMAAMAAANLLAGLRGERLPNPINPEVYE
jgi:lactate dehydrogenase-like 2-hydroxyacid dehydrogenase